LAVQVSKFEKNWNNFQEFIFFVNIVSARPLLVRRNREIAGKKRLSKWYNWLSLKIVSDFVEKRQKVSFLLPNNTIY